MTEPTELTDEQYEAEEKKSRDRQRLEKEERRATEPWIVAAFDKWAESGYANHPEFMLDFRDYKKLACFTAGYLAGKESRL